MIKSRIDLEPVAKGRAKTHFINGQAITFTPTKTKQAQDSIKVLVNQYKDSFPMYAPLKLTVTFYRHKSIWLKGVARKEKLPVRKPDLDNFIKLLLDSIDKVIMPDDAQITSIVARKRYSDNGIGYIEFELEPDTEY